MYTSRQVSTFSIEKLMQLSQQHASKNEHEFSLPLLDELVIRTKSQVALPLLCRCTNLIHLQKYELALKDAEAILKLKDDKIEEGLVKGSSSYHSAAYSRMHHILSKLNRNEEGAEILNKRALVEQNNKKQNKKDDKIIKLVDVLNDKGKKLVNKKEFLKGIEQFESALQYEVNLDKLYTNIAYCYIKLEDYNKVLFNTNQALLYNDKCTKAYYRQGIALYHLKEYESAMASFQNCLKLIEVLDPTIYFYLNQSKILNNNLKGYFHQDGWIYQVFIIVACFACVYYILNL